MYSFATGGGGGGWSIAVVPSVPFRDQRPIKCSDANTNDIFIIINMIIIIVIIIIIINKIIT